MHAASVRLLPVRVPVGLRVVVKAASEARVVPPGVIVPLGPGESGSRGEEREAWGGGSRTTALCYTAARSRRVVTTLLLGAGSPSGVLTLRRPVGAYPWAEWPHPKPKFRPHLRLQIWRNRPQAHLRAAMPFPDQEEEGPTPGAAPRPVLNAPPPNNASGNCQEGLFIFVLQTGTPTSAAAQGPKHKRSCRINTTDVRAEASNPPYRRASYQPVPVSVVFFPVRIVFRIIPIPPVTGAGVPESGAIVVSVPAARICERGINSLLQQAKQDTPPALARETTPPQTEGRLEDLRGTELSSPKSA